MENKPTSLELARQTLIQLAKTHSHPTPENYRRVYEEIAGIQSKDQTNILQTTLEKVLLEQSKSNPTYVNKSHEISALIAAQDAPHLEAKLHALFKDASHKSDDTNWATLLRHLLKQLESNHNGITLSRKKEGLNRVIINFGKHPDQLGAKIQALVASWGSEQPGIEVPEADHTNISTNQEPSALNLNTAPPIQHQSPDVNVNNNEMLLATDWRDMLIRTIRLVVMPQFTDVPSATHRIEGLIKLAQEAKTREEVQQLNEALKATLLRTEMQNDAQHRMQEALIQILRLIVSSMGELTIEDKWLHGQLAIVSEIISKPLNLDTVYNAESSLKELIFKQANIKPGLLAAKDTLRNMVSTFVSRLADITESTGSYQAKIQDYQNKISTTENILDLSGILESLVGDISIMNENAKQSHVTLQDTQKKVEDAEKQINELTIKLDYISEVAHEDFLTGALNRRGMDDAITREFDRADRHHTAISLAMLDIDHFKKINDTLGHSAGDKALAHLAKVVKGILRSTDILARYGGEEFVVLLPGSKQDDAVTVVSGLQRELTKNFFLNNNERVLITFSAGVAERMPGEEIDSVLPRADAALYLAKQTGRNRVIGAEAINSDSEQKHL